MSTFPSEETRGEVISALLDIAVGGEECYCVAGEDCGRQHAQRVSQEEAEKMVDTVLAALAPYLVGSDEAARLREDSEALARVNAEIAQDEDWSIIGIGRLRRTIEGPVKPRRARSES